MFFEKKRRAGHRPKYGAGSALPEGEGSNDSAVRSLPMGDPRYYTKNPSFYVEDSAWKAR